MTTTMMIVGSRAREQVPGTSITLRATGFRGALTQLAGADLAPGADMLPFDEAAAGAGVMLASQLVMQLQGRPADDKAEPRFRSASATPPRLIVPRRPGVAYALLQTGTDGTSAFMLPGAHDAEANFILPMVAPGATRRTLRVLMWPTAPLLNAGPRESLERWERERRAERLVCIHADGSRGAANLQSLGRGPALLLLHGSLGTSESAFGAWISSGGFREIARRYDGRCFAFEHPTLVSAPAETADWLRMRLPVSVGPLDIVAHGRGGLVARLLAGEARLAVRNVCLVGVPNEGTPLAHPSHLLDWLNGHVALLARLPAPRAVPILEGALSLLRVLGTGLDPDLPGLRALRPGSPFRPQSVVPESPGTRWFTIGAGYSGPAQSGDFAGCAHDLVVPGESCHRPGAEVTDSLRLAGAAAHHHSYFVQHAVREKLDQWLRG
jgi:pimeloyl-ACP methyl ester carboxylesterase